MNNNLYSYIKDAVDSHPNSTAYENLGTQLTYEDLYHKALHVASYLKCLGVEPGDRVGIMLPNLLQQPIITLGCLMHGVTIVNINPLYTCLLYTSPSPRDGLLSRMPSSA